MLNIKPHRVTRGGEGEAITLVFYPDTGCLRFADALGVFHELRPPHSWIAISSASRGVCQGEHAMTEVLNTLLREFCASRPRWANSSARASVAVAASFRAPGHTRVHARDETPARGLTLASVASGASGAMSASGASVASVASAAVASVAAPVVGFGAGLQA
jgi:hypothetical protein